MAEENINQDQGDDDELLKNQGTEGQEDEGSTDEGQEGSAVSTEEEELNSAADDNEREKIRERRRQERHDRKNFQKEEKERLRRELASEREARRNLEERLSIIERKSQGGEVAQLDVTMKQTADAYNYFKQQIQVATEAADGRGVADATEKMLMARQRYEELGRIKNAYQQRQNQPAPLDPRLVNHAQAWLSNNKWYDTSARDTDSRIVKTLDDGLAQEGWDPTTEAYWEELSERVKKHLPHRSQRGTNTGKPKNIVGGGSKESGGSQSQGTFKLSSERVAALKEAGMWNDPTQREAAIKRFREYDKQHGGKQ